jgi:amino acid transporter
MKRKKLSKDDKWMLIAAINLMAFCISGLVLVLTDALASPPTPTILLIVLGGLTSLFFCISLASYGIARLAMASQRKVMLQDEIDRLSQMLNDLKK